MCVSVCARALSAPNLAALESFASRPGLLQLLVLASDRESTDVHWDWHHDFGIPGRLSRFGVSVARLHPFPFGPSVLKPDFDLYFAKFEGMGYLGSLGQRQVFLAVKFLLQFQQLFAGESCSPPSVFARRCTGCGGFVVEILIQARAGVLSLVSGLRCDVIIRTVIEVTVHGKTLIFAFGIFVYMRLHFVVSSVSRDSTNNCVHRFRDWKRQSRGVFAQECLGLFALLLDPAFSLVQSHQSLHELPGRLPVGGRREASAAFAGARQSGHEGSDGHPLAEAGAEPVGERAGQVAHLVVVVVRVGHGVEVMLQ